MMKILCIDDQIEEFSKSLNHALDDHTLLLADSGAKGLTLLEEHHDVALVILDIKMPALFAERDNREGLETLKKIRAAYPHLPVIMLTQIYDVDTIVEAIKEGAFHYIEKPVDLHKLRQHVKAAIEQSRLQKEVKFFKKVVDLRDEAQPEEEAPEEVDRFDSIIGASKPMRKVFSQIRAYAPYNETVLILGETGTGKELVARELHRHSPRAKKPFKAVNCASIPEALLESEFFGHTKGAFTGAVTDRKGVLETATGGTVFLDEIGDMPMSLQAKLLRFLQDKTISPVGSSDEKIIDVRVISATNRDPKSLIRKGQFREDLYYRLNVLTIKLPPLEVRDEDVDLLAREFVVAFSKEYNVPSPEISPDALKKLRGHDWPGNVRELESLLKRIIIEARPKTIHPKHIRFEKTKSAPFVENEPEPDLSSEDVWSMVRAGEIKIDDLTEFRNTYGEQTLVNVLKNALEESKNIAAAGRLIGYLSSKEDKQRYDNLRKWLNRLGVRKRR